jgi:Ca2+-binding RTX toxin-like protein
MLNFESILAGSGNDTITGTADVNFLGGGAGNDIINGGAGNDSLDGGAGNDLLNGEDGDDTIFGYAGDDIINGGAGDDYLYGDAGGLVGNDSISGGAGNDKIGGGAGNDIITGGDGNDYFGFDVGFAISATNTLTNALGTDTIADFTQGSDKIVLNQSTFGIASFNSSNFGVVADDTAAGGSAFNIVYSQATKTLFYNQDGGIGGFGAGGAIAVVNGLATGVDLALTDITIG